MLDHIKDLVGFAFEHGLWVCRVWYTRVYQNMTSNGGLAPRRLHGWLWPVEVARWLGSTLGDMNHKPMASPSMVCTFYLPCITPQNVQFGTPGCTGSRRLDTWIGLHKNASGSAVWSWIGSTGDEHQRPRSSCESSPTLPLCMASN